MSETVGVVITEIPEQKRRKVVLYTGSDTPVKQADKSKCDINKIIAKHDRTGMINHLNGRKPFYGDVSEVEGYQQALDKVTKAQELFMGLSGTIRKRFRNDPEEFINFVNDENNREEAVELGLIEKPPEVVETGQGDISKRNTPEQPAEQG